jgi:hypothetical protein
MKTLPKRKMKSEPVIKRVFIYEIAVKLSVSVGTYQHIHNIYEKLHVSNRTEAINKLQRR